MQHKRSSPIHLLVPKHNMMDIFSFKMYL